MVGSVVSRIVMNCAMFACEMCNVVNAHFLKNFDENNDSNPQQLKNGSAFRPHSTQKAPFCPL